MFRRIFRRMFPRGSIGSSCDTPYYIRRAGKIGSRLNILRAWYAGRRDGRAYGPSQITTEFEQNCQWLKQQLAKKNVIRGEAIPDVNEWMRLIQAEKDKEALALNIAMERIATRIRETSDTSCDHPSMKPAARTIYFVLMFIFEFLFSAVVLTTSGLGSTAEELGISVVAAGVLVLLSEKAGQSLRQLPLAKAKTPLQRRNHYISFSIMLCGLAIALGGITYLRSVGEQAGSDDKMQQAVKWTFLAIGFALVLIGIFKGGDHEYSGPKYGLANLEHERVRSESAIITYETGIKRLGDFPVALDMLLQTNVDKLFAVYADQYKRSALARGRAKGHV